MAGASVGETRESQVLTGRKVRCLKEDCGGPCVRPDGTPQIPAPVVGPGSPCGETSTLSLSHMQVSEKMGTWCEEPGLKMGEDRAPVLPGVKVRTLMGE